MIALQTLERIKKKLAAGELSHLLATDSNKKEDDNSHESVDWPRKKIRSSPIDLLTSEEGFILKLNTCLSMDLGFHALLNDDKWCCRLFQEYVIKNGILQWILILISVSSSAA